MTQLFSDDFNRADNADLGANWANLTGATLKIVSNNCVPSNTGTDCCEENSSTTLPNDQYAEVTFAATAANGVDVGMGPICRAVTASGNYYRLIGNASGYECQRRNAGSPTVLSSGTGTTFAAGDVLRLQVATAGADCAWTLQKNGTTFASGTDTSPLASGKAGIFYSGLDAGTTVTAYASGNLDVIYTDAPEALFLVRSAIRLN